MKKKYLYSLCVIVAATFFYFGCTPKGPAVKIDLTLEELKQYDGREGRPTYVAVDGDVYDISKCRHWNNGQHPTAGPEIRAGRDLTAALKRSRHGIRHLMRYPVIGKIVVSKE